MGLITASSINFDLLPTNRVIGYYIYDEEEKDVTDIRDLLVDDKTHEPRYAIIEIGGFLSIAGKKLLIPWVSLVKGGMSRMDINCSAEHMMYTPLAHDQLNPTRAEEESIHFHFNAEPYWINDHEEKTEPAPTAKPPVNNTSIEDLSMEDNDTK